MTPAAKITWQRVLPFFLFFIILFVWSSRLPFFWDKDILFSKLGFWLPEHHFSPELPNELDAGYPPALGYLLAAIWSLFGRSLFSAHLLMLPFTLGIVWQTYKFLKYLALDKFSIPAMVLLFADTVFLSQTVVFSTDLVMLFFMILSINAIHEKKPVMLALAVAGLLFSHPRGLMVAVTLAAYSVFLMPGRRNLPALFRVSLPYLPGAMLFGAWMAWHYFSIGWIFVHPESPWAGCYEPIHTLKDFLRNVLILGWRMLDYGRIFVWIIPALAIFGRNRSRILKDPVLRSLVFLLVVSLVTTLPAMLGFKILNGHRYLIPFYFLLSVASAYLLFKLPGFQRFRTILFTVVLAGMVSGSFWVYPGKIANGWDATLAHLPYHHLRRQMISYIEERKIPFEKIGSEVPNISVFKFIDLSDDERRFTRADLQTHEYVFYSNVFNMFTDEEIDELNNNWAIEKEYRCLQVFVRLYHKKDFHSGPLIQQVIVHE